MQTAAELLKGLIDDAQYQFSKLFEGLTDEHVDAKPLASMWSIREMVEHLCEVYVATYETTEGKEHAWGSYAAPDKAWQPLTDEFWRLREAASEAVLATEDPKVLSAGSMFLVSHDCYHVGQMAATRIAISTEWDPYSIYNF